MVVDLRSNTCIPISQDPDCDVTCIAFSGPGQHNGVSGLNDALKGSRLFPTFIRSGDSNDVNHKRAREVGEVLSFDVDDQTWERMIGVMKQASLELNIRPRRIYCTPEARNNTGGNAASSSGPADMSALMTAMQAILTQLSNEPSHKKSRGAEEGGGNGPMETR
jgi:hypothetical protein